MARSNDTKALAIPGADLFPLGTGLHRQAMHKQGARQAPGALPPPLAGLGL
jgi:hypothetical protein